MKFAREFLLYGVAGALSRLASFLLVPLYTRTLDQREFGELEILLSLHLLAVLTIGLQGESALARDFFRARRDGREKQLVCGAFALAAVGMSLTLAAAAVAIGFGIPRYVLQNLPLLLAAGLITHILGVQLVVLRFAHRSMHYGLLSLCDVVVTALTSVVLIVVLDLGISGALAGVTIGKATTMIIAWPHALGRCRRSDVSLAPIREMMAYSLPTMPAVMLNWVQTLGTRVVWSIFFTVGAVAVASVSMRVAAAFGMVVYAFRLAWEPMAFRLLENDAGGRARFTRAFGHVALLAFISACCATLAAPLLTALFAPPAYRDAASLVGILMMGQVWLTVILVTQMGIHGARVTSRVVVVYLASSLVNISVLAAIAATGELAATAWAQFAGSVVGAILAAWFSNRHFDMRLSYRLMSVLAIVTTVVCVCSNRWPAFGTTLWPHPYSAIAMGLGVVILWVAGMDAELRGTILHDYRAAPSSLRNSFRKPAERATTLPDTAGHQEN